MPSSPRHDGHQTDAGHTGALAVSQCPLSLLQTICTVVGPAVGGLTVAAFGAPIGFTANAASFLASVLTVAVIRARVQRTRRGRTLGELRAGWTEIRRHDWLQAGIFAATAYHIANGVIIVLVPVVAVTELGGASAIGAIYAAEGLGGVLGAAIALRYKPRRLLFTGWLALLVMPLWALSYVWPGTLNAVLAGAIVGYCHFQKSTAQHPACFQGYAGEY